MRSRIAIAITAAVVLSACIIWWLFHSPMPPAPQLPSPSPSAATQTTPAGAQVSLPTPKEDAVDYDGRSMTREEATRIYVQRVRQDENYDWKQPLNLYGKVVDQDNHPVPDASVHMVWTTLGVPGGSSEIQTSSDGDGLFSLTNQQGKVLEVQVQKNGYYTVNRGGSAVPFNYANPSDPSYIEPDANNPVVFHLRKKGLNGAQLLHWQRNVALNAQNKKALDLRTGQTTNGETLSLSVDVLENSGKFGAFAWSARVSVTGGGSLQLTTDQFPFLAPASGYQPSVDVNMTTPKPPVWNQGAGGEFYVQTPTGYGRYTISMAVGVNSMEVEGYFNPTPGDRNLEPATQP